MANFRVMKQIYSINVYSDNYLPSFFKDLFCLLLNYFLQLCCVNMRKTKLHNFCVTFEEDDSYMTSYKGKRKREGGKKISSKKMREKGIVFLKSYTKFM